MAAAGPEYNDTMDEPNVRARDFLNDKLQTQADMDNIDSLLLGVKNQQTLLRKQLHEAEVKLDKSQRASQHQQTLIIQKAEAFSKKQSAIDVRLLNLTNAKSGDEAVALLEGSMKKLQDLDIAIGYVELLKEVDDLSTQARQHITTSPETALKPYTRLQHISRALRALQPAAEGAAPHLVNHVETASQKLWQDMRDTLSAEFEQTLQQMKWPSREADFEHGSARKWEEGVKKLLMLQYPELVATFERNEPLRVSSEAVVLLPLEVMVRPLELRFRYHFEGDRPTNRLDKPEYFLSHITDLLDMYAPVLAVHLQPILRSYFQAVQLTASSLYTDSTSALITSLLPMLRKKIFAFLPQIAREPQLLSHFIHELIDFDTHLREEWQYHPDQGASSWKGLSWEVLVGKDWFGRWLNVEKDFALSRYQHIIEAKDAWEIDYDSVDSKSTKPTKAAMRVNDLLETVTDRYRPLASFSQKLQFLIDIQIAIFDKFHNRLHSALEAYLAATSTVVRAVQGATRDDNSGVEGIKGLERLSRVYGSADYLEAALDNWSDDIFFLELWDELQNRARQKTGKTFAGPLTIEDITERTSSAVGSDSDSGALFDETASAYRKLRSRTGEIISDLLAKSTRDALRPYSKINPWSLLDVDTSDLEETSTSAELDGLLDVLDSSLHFLSRALARGPLRYICRQLSLSIQTYLWDYVLLRHTFSANGAKQFRRDMMAVSQVLDGYIGAGQGELGMRKIHEATQLLNLPRHVEDDGSDLQEVEDEVFASNERARQMLEKLGLVNLTEIEARNILTRRVDLAG